MPSTSTDVASLSHELQAVAHAAGGQLQASAQDNDDAEREARQAKVAAAAQAMDAGHEFDEIARAEALGRDEARQSLSQDLLKRVSRATQRRSEAEREYREAIRRAVRVGIPHRVVGDSAGVSHATVRSIADRTLQASALDGSPIEGPSDASVAEH